MCLRGGWAAAAAPHVSHTTAVSVKRGACLGCLLLHPDGLFAPRDVLVTLQLNTWRDLNE